MPFKLAPRLQAFDYVGFHRYFLTICVLDRAAVFTANERVQPMLLQFQRTCGDRLFAGIAYCFMPDHLHALVEGTREDSDFKEFVRIFKQRSSYRWKRQMGTELWQRGYNDRVLRADEGMVTVARYLLNNPVRARLVRSAQDYPFLGSLTMDVRDLLDSVQITRRPT
jgi:putative transposase